MISLLITLPAVAQNTDVFSSQFTQTYKQNSLTVSLSGVQLANDAGNTLEVGCSTCWTPYKGYERVSESSFFKIAGYDHLAEQAERSRRNKFIAMGLGGLSMIAGSVLLSNSFSNSGIGNNPQVGQIFAGVFLLGGGGATIGFSAVGLQSRSVPYELARDVASGYNNQLLQEIGSEQK